MIRSEITAAVIDRTVFYIGKDCPAYGLAVIIICDIIKVRGLFLTGIRHLVCDGAVVVHRSVVLFPDNSTL